MVSVTITVRVPKELKVELDRYRVEVSSVVRRALEKEVRRRRLEELKRAAARLGAFLAEVSDEEIVARIRKARRFR